MKQVEQIHKTTNEQIEAMVLLRDDIPPIRTASSKEIERRRNAVQRLQLLRERIGPIGIRADDLLHAARDDAER